MYDLFPHQNAGADFLAERKFAGLFFGMGTGKTVTALEAFCRCGAGTMLVIAPPIALPMWQKEAMDYLVTNDGYRIQILKTGATIIDSDAYCLVVSYAIATARKAELKQWVEDTNCAVIIDESHALKSSKAKRTQAIIGRGGITENALHTWLLTGTPITRWNDDMYTFLARADLSGMKERCGGVTLDRFQFQFTVRQKRKFAGARFPVNMVVGNRHTVDMAEWVYGGEHAMRVDLEEVFKAMPPLTKTSYIIPMELDAELRSQLKDLEKHSIAEIRDKLQSKEPALATVRRRIGVAKVKASAKEILERVESGQQVLVGAWHTEVIDELAAALFPKVGVRTIKGATSSHHRQEAIDLWNAGNLPVLVGQIAAMGVSLNLQRGGHQIIVVEEDWSPAVMDQFYARLWRYGQEKPVHVTLLQSDNKLDKALNRIAGTKAQQQQLFNSIGQEITDAN